MIPVAEAISAAGTTAMADCFILPMGQNAGGGAAPASFRGIVPTRTSAPTTQSSSETDISSEESVYGDVSDRNSAEGLLEDGISSANVPVQALKFNPEASIFALDERSSFSVQELRRQSTCTEKLSVRARDKQLVEILTAAIMKNGRPLDIAACKSALCAPSVPER